jgi:hypothetical protein
VPGLNVSAGGHRQCHTNIRGRTPSPQINGVPASRDLRPSNSNSAFQLSPFAISWNSDLSMGAGRKLDRFDYHAGFGHQDYQTARDPNAAHGNVVLGKPEQEYNVDGVWYRALL